MSTKRNIRVLHADDDPELASVTADMLEREENRLSVETVTSASDGLARLSATRFDCIVSDYDMPDQNGLEFLRAVRDRYPTLPFILYTGKGSEAVAEDAISAGVTDYLQKGVGADQYAVLANRIRNAVERRDAERERTRQLEAIETAREGISILDADGQYIYANQQFADLHGYDPEELIGKHWELVYPEEDVPKVREEILPAVERAGYWHGETVSLRADGDTVPVDHTLATTERGELVCTVRDISDRKERTRKLQQKTARLEALFENSPDMINVHDTNGEILDPNPRLCEKTGYDASEITDMTVWELDREIDPDAARTLWQEMEVGENRRLESRYKRADGSTFPVEVHISRFRFEGRDRFVAIARDITERKERDRNLEKQQTIVETAPDPIAVVGVDGRFRYVNPALCDLTGYTETSLLGGHFSLIKPDEETSRMEETIEEVMTGAKPAAKRSEALLQTATGESRICEDHVAALPDGDAGRSDEVVVVHRDVTERVNRQRELEQRKDRLDEFASIVSHDLRNPLKTARGRLELAMKDCDSEQLPHVDRALDRMDTLIQDLLTLTRSGDTVADHEPVDFEAVAKDCWGIVGTARSTLTARADRMVYADRSRLKQVFENLIRNAVEHGGDDVTVTVGELDDGFYVEDDGPGIPEERRDEVFSAGYSTSETGTGFGLSIVRQIAEAHGWDVRITDGTDGGARFEFANVTFAK